MRKKVISLVLMLLVASLLLSGCALVVKDPVKDAARLILDVNGDTVTKGEFLEKVSEQTNSLKSYYAYYNQMYQMYYGYSQAMPSDAEIRTEAIQAAHDDYVRQFVIDQQLKSLNLDTLTEEEMAVAQAEAEKNYDQLLQQIIDGNYLTDTEAEGDALKEEAKKYAEETLNAKLDTYVESAVRSAKEDKLRDYVIKDVAVTDQEVQDQYTVNVNDAKKQYEEDITAFGTAVNNGSKVYYSPAGYRYVKQILVKFTEEDQKAIDDANKAVSDAQTALNSAKDAVTANENAQNAEDATEEAKAELAEARPALDQAVTDAQAAYDEAQAAAQKAVDTGFANLQAKVDEIQQKIKDGADFDALIEEYNEDPGMQTEPGKTNGYAVCEGYTPFMAEFVDAAMALANVGDVSEPVRNAAYGIHILKYVADIPEGETGLEAFAEEIRASLLSSKQDETYNNQLTAWTDAANIKYYADRLDD